MSNPIPNHLVADLSRRVVEITSKSHGFNHNDLIAIMEDMRDGNCVIVWDKPASWTSYTKWPIK